MATATISVRQMVDNPKGTQAEGPRHLPGISFDSAFDVFPGSNVALPDSIAETRRSISAAHAASASGRSARRGSRATSRDLGLARGLNGARRAYPGVTQPPRFVEVQHRAR
jgi:hypothetical protein